MNCKGLYIGSIATVIYILNVVISGFVIENYNHFQNSLHEITFLGSESLLIITILYFAYNVGLILVAAGPSRVVHDKIVKITLWTLGVIGLLGIIIFFLPPDNIGANHTTTGIIRMVITSIIILLISSAPITANYSLKQVDRKKDAKLSGLSAVIILITGAIGIFGLLFEWEYIGLWERLSMGVFLIWMVWFTLKLKKIIYKDYI